MNGFEIRILNLVGQTIQVKRITGVADPLEWQMELSTVSSGIYLLEITTGDQSMAKLIRKE